MTVRPSQGVGSQQYLGSTGRTFVRLCWSSRGPEISDNAKFWPAELDPVPFLKVFLLNYCAFLLLKISGSYRVHTFTDVYKRCKKVEKSKG